jgi:hypothetical protein
VNKECVAVRETASPPSIIDLIQAQSDVDCLATRHPPAPFTPPPRASNRPDLHSRCSTISKHLRNISLSITALHPLAPLYTSSTSTVALYPNPLLHPPTPPTTWLTPSFSRRSRSLPGKFFLYHVVLMSLSSICLWLHQWTIDEVVIGCRA